MMINYFRATFILQLLAAVSILIAFFLPWQVDEGSGVALALSIFEDIEWPDSIANPWWFLWVFPLVGFVNGVRGILGTFYYEVLWRRLAFVLCVMAGILMFWFYAAFATDASPLATKNFMDLRPGYWLTASSLVLLLALIWFEDILPTEDPKLKRLARLAPDDPERLWSGYYRICPYCASTNDPNARRCVSCGIYLFPEEKASQAGKE